jgi:hypothetical protein
LIKWGAGGALVLWCVSTAFGGLAVQSDSPTRGRAGQAIEIGLVATLAVWLLAMLVWGFLLARRRWWDFAVWSAVAVTLLVLASYVAMMAASPEPGSDDGAAVGLFLGAVPVFVLVSGLIGLGAGAGVLSRHLHPRSASIS